MKIVLVAPPGTISQKLYTMNEVGGLASVLMHGSYKVEILDCQGSSRDLEILHSFGNESIQCISVILQWESYMKDRGWLLHFMRYTKNRFSHTHLNCVGRAATIFYREILKSIPCDSVILGEGEESLFELCTHLKDGKDWKKIRGIAFREREMVIATEKRPAISNLDSLPFPFRGYLQDRRRYPIVPLYTSRSCYGKCLFCPGRIRRNANISVSSVRMRSAENVVQEIVNIVKEYGHKRFYFVDDNFIPDRENGIPRAKKIAHLILERGLDIRFYIECRVNEIEEDLFTLLRKAGLRKVFLGIESGAETVLHRYRKETDIKTNIRAINILKKLRIDIDAGFIMFDPWTTFHELEENLGFLKETGIHKFRSLNSVFNSLDIYPNSDIERLYKYRKGKMDKRVSLVRNMLKWAESLIYEHGIFTKEGLKLHRESSFFENRKRDILFRIFEETITSLRNVNQIGKKEIEDIRSKVEGMVKELLTSF